MSKQIKVGMITDAGGAHVGAYLAALSAAENCGKVVLVDPDSKWEEQARRVLGKKLIKVYRDRREMFADERPEMVLVTLEARLAPPVIDESLEAGCHVFAEKPSCIRIEDFEALVRKADSKHLHLMLALANRLNPEIVEAKRLIARGTIGKLYGIEMHLVADQTRLKNKSYQQKWFSKKERSGGGHLIWLGIHWLDLAMYTTGAAVREVAGFTENVGGQPINVEDSATAALRFENGMLGTMTSGYYLDKGYHSHIKIWGSGGWLLIESMENAPLHWYSTQGVNAGVMQTWKGSKEPRGYTPFVGAAVKACAEKTDPPINGADSLRALQTVFSIYSSDQTGRKVRIEG